MLKSPRRYNSVWSDWKFLFTGLFFLLLHLLYLRPHPKCSLGVKRPSHRNPMYFCLNSCHFTLLCRGRKLVQLIQLYIPLDWIPRNFPEILTYMIHSWKKSIKDSMKMTMTNLVIPWTRISFTSYTQAANYCRMQRNFTFSKCQYLEIPGINKREVIRSRKSDVPWTERKLQGDDQKCLEWFSHKLELLKGHIQIVKIAGTILFELTLKRSILIHCQWKNMQ